ncbi:MAG: UvrD-helicase domain-containing protein, partial [Rhodospirillales bacterium]|nr:UvrD-helicase domain-containing protein [Rhodospirillales bacterium]
MESQLLEGLTEPQREAMTHVDGPLLVLAGPGSGKTRVITGRIAHLVAVVGIPSWNILAITFTNKAAGEMRLRVERMLDERDARRMGISTFHSLCARLLRLYADRVGLPPGYSIYDTSDQKNAVKAALDDLEISSKNFPPASMLASISSAKNELFNAEAYKTYANDFYTRTVHKVFARYEQVLERNQAVDFDDLLLKTVQLFRNHPDVLDQCRQRYQYILIDEYQDTNHAQFVLANALAAEHKNICATGDPDQSIYAWRGANIRNILEFESHYPDAKVVRLEQNFRSTSRILAAADTLIRYNTRRKHKELWTDNDSGDAVAALTFRDERHAADAIARKLKELHEEHDMPWGGMAVFYRINSLSRVVEEAMRDAAIPYQIARGTAFYDRKEIKDAIAYLRAIVNPADEINLLRIINTPARGISDKTVKAAQATALQASQSLTEVLRTPDHIPALNTRA